MGPFHFLPCPGGLYSLRVLLLLLTRFGSLSLTNFGPGFVGWVSAWVLLPFAAGMGSDIKVAKRPVDTFKHGG